MLKNRISNIIEREGVFALPFKFFVAFFVILSLCACSSKTYTPSIPAEFESKAVCSFGDFSYECKINKTENEIIFEALSTNAKGLVIKFDGKTVSFQRNELLNEFPYDVIDVTNPAVVLYEVLFSLENAKVTVSDNEYIFSGTTRAGEYSLALNKANQIKSININSANISFNIVN